MESYHDAARVAGAKATVACTVPPSTSFSGPQETQRQALNLLLLASSHFDAVADLAAVPEAEDPTDTQFYSDGLHPTSALAVLFAEEIALALSS